MKITIGILGLGTIGEAVLSAWKKNAAFIKAKTAITINVKSVCDTRSSARSLVKGSSLIFTRDAQQVIQDPDIDLVVELIGGVHPAKELIVSALANGKHVVTANKAVLAAHGPEIFQAAAKAQRAIGFEASVGGGIPLMKNIIQGLSGARVKAVYGILNGTTNYILDKMSKENADFKVALKQAQQEGYAERNPALDIKGFDSLHKISVLSHVCFGRSITPQEQVYVEGIDRISPQDVFYAEELGYVIKLLAIARQHNDVLAVRVHPALIPKTHLLSNVRGVYNAIYIKTDLQGVLTFYGLGAGGDTTAAAVLSDIVDIAKGNAYYKDVLNLQQANKALPLGNIERLQSSYYIRIAVKDKPGVLSRIATILAEYKISIASVNQKQRCQGQFVPIVMVTHEAQEASIQAALKEIDKLALVKPASQIIRIERLS